MADNLTYKFNYTIGGVETTVNCFPVVPELVFSKDSSEYKNIITNNTTFVFKNKKSEGVADYDLIKTIEEDSIFNKIYIQTYKNNVLFKTVYFFPVDCKFDDDRCTCEVTPTYSDVYNCLYNNWEKEYNILKFSGNDTLEPVNYDIDNPANLELFTCIREYEISIPNGLTETNFFAKVSMDGLYGFDTNGLFYDDYRRFHGIMTDVYDWHPAYQYWQIHTTSDFTTPNFPYYTSNITTLQTIVERWRIYKNKFFPLEYLHDNPPHGYKTYRMRVETTWCCETMFTANNSDGSANHPGGAWIYFDTSVSTVAGIHGHWYGREPFRTAYDEYFSAYGNGDLAYSYFGFLDAPNQFDFVLKNPYTWTFASTTPITRGRELIATMNYLLGKMDCNLTINSKFLVGYGNNPLTLEPNPVYILTKAYDIKNPLWSDNPATELFLSFQWLLEEVCKTFNLRWYIKEGGIVNELIIEHLNYFENNFNYTPQTIVPYDLTIKNEISTGQKEIIATDKYTYNLGELFNTESWQFSEYLDYDFAKLNIDYDMKFNKELKRKDELLALTTDVAGIISDPGKFSDDSVVLVACRQGDTPITISENGYRTNKQVTNGWMCLSNLFDRFYRYGRVLKYGVLDAGNLDLEVVETPTEEEFRTVKNNKLQEIEVRDCEGEMFYSQKEIKTNLGTGRVLSAEYQVRKDVTKFNLLLK